MKHVCFGNHNPCSSSRPNMDSMQINYNLSHIIIALAFILSEARMWSEHLSGKCIHIYKKNSVMNPLMNASETCGSFQTIIGPRCLEGVFFSHLMTDTLILLPWNRHWLCHMASRRCEVHYMLLLHQSTLAHKEFSLHFAFLKSFAWFTDPWEIACNHSCLTCCEELFLLATEEENVSTALRSPEGTHSVPHSGLTLVF